MPYTQCYEDITRTCEGCGRGLVASRVEVSFLLLRVVYYCVICEGEWRTYSYRFKERCFTEEEFRGDERTWCVSWACEGRCGWSSHATRIEMSSKFLRVSFRCIGCHGRATRYYDLEQHGYVDVTGRVVPLTYPFYDRKSINRGEYAGVKECEFMEHCPRYQVKHLANLVRLRPAPYRSGVVVATVAEVCPGMNDWQVESCYNRLFAHQRHGERFPFEAHTDDPEVESFREAYRQATVSEGT